MLDINYVMVVTVSVSIANGIVSILVAPIIVGWELRVVVMSVRTCRHRELSVVLAVCTASAAELPIVLDTMWVFVNILCGIGLLPTPSRLSAVDLDNSLLLIGMALLGSITSILLGAMDLIVMALQREAVVLDDLSVVEDGRVVIPWKLLFWLLESLLSLLLAPILVMFMLGCCMMRVARGVVATSVARSSLVPDRVHLLTVLLDETTSIMV